MIMNKNIIQNCVFRDDTDNSVQLYCSSDVFGPQINNKRRNLKCLLGLYGRHVINGGVSPSNTANTVTTNKTVLA